HAALRLAVVLAVRLGIDLAGVPQLAQEPPERPDHADPSRLPRVPSVPRALPTPRAPATALRPLRLAVARPSPRLSMDREALDYAVVDCDADVRARDRVLELLHLARVDPDALLAALEDLRRHPPLVSEVHSSSLRFNTRM